MNLFCFASRNLENIRRGIVARRWAVSTASDSTNRGRRTKAARYFSPGDRGLLYCEQTHSFTTPFIVESKADPDIVVKHVWPEPWVLPFSITPLGDLEKQLPGDAARTRWPLLAWARRRYGGPEYHWRYRLFAGLNHRRRLAVDLGRFGDVISN